MTIRNVLVAALIGTASLVASALPSAAAIISQTQSIAVDYTDWTDTLTFAKFDPSMGTLNSVKFILDGKIEGYIAVESKDASATTINSELKAIITLYRPDNSIIAQSAPMVSFIDNLTAWDHVLDFGGGSGETHSSLSSSVTVAHLSPPPLSDLTDFLGLGNIILPIEAKAKSKATGSGNLVTDFETSAGAKVTIEYNYTANSVPEPGTLALLGTGLVGFGAARRRKAKASA